MQSVAAEAARLESDGATVMFVAVDGRIEGVIGISDEIKPNAARSVDALRALGLRVIMLTGDNAAAAGRAASAAGIDEYRAGVRPEDKLDLVELAPGARDSPWPWQVTE